jgi:hypothetical protein
MSRNIDSTMASHLNDSVLYPAVLVEIHFRSQVSYAWSGAGPLLWNGKTFLGVGSLALLGSVSESSTVQADGTTIGLSGIDPTLRAECLTDIRQGAAAKKWLALFDANGTLLGTPYLYFSGQVDKPSFSVGGEKMEVSLTLENRMINGQRANMRRYCSADQALDYPLDSGFDWVEAENEIALRWG